MFSRVFGLLIRGNLRGLLAFLLGFALLGALWNASLFRLSSHDSATGMMTQVGVQVLNPVLTNPLAKSQFSSLSSSGFATFQKNCTGTSSAIPGFGKEVQVPCADIKSATKLDDALPALYGAVAEAYYQHGATGVFDVPGPLEALLSGKSIVPDISTVPGTSVQVPHLPDNPLLQVGSAFGFSLSTLTAAGHADEQNKTLWFGGAALALLLLLGLTSRGGKRLSAMGHALIGGAIPGVVILGAVQFISSRYPEQSAVFTPLLGYVKDAFIPVYIGAAVLGVLLYVAAFVWRRVSQSMAEGRQAEAVPVGAGARARAGEASGGYGGNGGSYGGGGYGQPTPRYNPPSSAAPQYPPRYPQPDPWAPPAPPQPASGQGAYGQRPSPSYGERQPYGGQPGHGGQQESYGRQPGHGGQQESYSGQPSYGGQAPYGGQQPRGGQP
ncbi:MAG TPA: hypothetical protein VFY89_03500, partial [Ktedonobacterales bacterium]